MLPQLVLVRRLFLEASKYGGTQDAVAAGIATSLLQDSVELYVWTVIKERGVSVKDQAGFVSNLDSLSRAGIAMPYTARLLELNRARVNFKHYGNLPAPTELEKYRTYAEEALRQGMQDHFSIEFDELTLIDLVVDTAIREFLRQAELQIQEAKFPEAAADLAKAKTLTFGLMQKYLPKVDWSLRDADRMFTQIAGVRSAGAFTYVAEYLGMLREASLVAMLQLPLEDYSFLKNSLPSASQSRAGTWQVIHTGTPYSEAQCRQAVSCIVSLCIRLQSRA